MIEHDRASREHDVLLLDFGGVCLLNPVELHAQTEAALGLEPGTLDWMGPLDPSTDSLWRRMVAADDLTEREYWALRATEVGELAGRPMETRDYMRLVYEPAHDGLIRPECVEVVRQALAAGFGVSVLTNDLRAFHGTEWEQGVAMLRMIDHLVDCSDTGILKPDPRAFTRAAELIGVPLDRMLFVDDQPINVQGGIDAGLDSVWFDVGNAATAWAGVASRLGL